MKPAGSILCLACGGKGYLTRVDYRGLPYPARCAACHGTGSQTVRA